MENRRRIIVAGAGAAGLAAAIFAARCGAEVTILEGMERPGKKLLLTGNGRCNITNLDTGLSKAYYGSGSTCAALLTESFTAKDMCRFLEEIGLLVQEKNGYVYPYTAQSSSVLEVLLAEVRRLKIKLKLSEKITKILPDCPATSVWTVKTATWQYQADAVILACGSKCMASTGSDGSGYALASALGHAIVPPAPALTPVICRYEYLQQLAGVRCRAKVSLYQSLDGQPDFGKPKHRMGLLQKQKLLAADTGELQWTRYGVSGIVVFQISRFVSTHPAKESLWLSVDLLPDFDVPKLRQLLTARAAQLKNEKAAVLLGGLLGDKLIPVILNEADRRLAKLTCAELTPSTLDALVSAMKQVILPVTDTRSFDTCQVCAGGISGMEFNPRTLESNLHPGLYFAGEIVDVDGPCGGYNLQWAWSSGYAAGCAAASQAL